MKDPEDRPLGKERQRHSDTESARSWLPCALMSGEEKGETGETLHFYNSTNQEPSESANLTNQLESLILGEDGTENKRQEP